MLYNVLDGPCTESFGINVAEMAGFPPSVIGEAKRKIRDLESCGSFAYTEQGREKQRREEEAMEKFAKLPVSTFPADKLREEVRGIFVVSDDDLLAHAQ